MHTRLGFAFAVLMASGPAFAGEGDGAQPPCPSVYGTWEIAYLTSERTEDGSPQPVGPIWRGLLIKAYIGHDKAGLVWLKDIYPDVFASSVYKRDTSLPQGDDMFYGHNANGAQVSADIIDGDLLTIFPGMRCLLYIGEARGIYRKNYTVEGPRQVVIMRKVK